MIKEEVKYLTKGSHSKVTVTCDFGVSDKCRGQYNYPYKDAPGLEITTKARTYVYFAQEP